MAFLNTKTIFTPMLAQLTVFQRQIWQIMLPLPA